MKIKFADYNRNNNRIKEVGIIKAIHHANTKYGLDRETIEPDNIDIKLIVEGVEIDFLDFVQDQTDTFINGTLRHLDNEEEL